MADVAVTMEMKTLYITGMEQALVCTCNCTQDVLKNMLIQYMQGGKIFDVHVHVCKLMHLGMKPIFC